MERSELYSHITPCGGLPYADLVYVIENMQVRDESIRYLMLQRAAQESGFIQADWIVLAKAAVYMSTSPINGLTVEAWLTTKTCLTAVELKSLLENIQFTDGSQSTIILSQTGDIIVAE